ncbi:L,D-transpeptidase [Streptomyces bobili]|uniref:L,D-transpeptidase n=1 Tax=Streptomyces bobili TaxID=67280 RepID=UPI003822E8C5
MKSLKKLLCTLATGSFLITGCSAEESAIDGPRIYPSPNPPEHRLVMGIANGQQEVTVAHGAQIKVFGGVLAKVTLTAADGTAVAGALSPDKTEWVPARPLSHGSRYHLSVMAKYTDGSEESREVSFTTLSQADALQVRHTPDDGSTVGVGMPISLTFDKPVVNKRSVERAIKVSSSSGQEVVGHWFSSQRLDLRPEHYWKAHSNVTLRIELEGVRAAEQAIGEENRTVQFTIGRRQVSTVDASARTMTVTRNDRVLRTLRVTAGSPASPTWNGQMVISEKLESTRMNGATVGFDGEYDIPDVPHAMRLSTSGTFVHGNYWASDGVFGNQNVSHGCIGLNDAKGGKDGQQDAAWLFRNSMIGDVIVVKNSTDRRIAPDNGLNGWNMSWKRWKAGSAA